MPCCRRSGTRPRWSLWRSRRPVPPTRVRTSAPFRSRSPRSRWKQRTRRSTTRHEPRVPARFRSVPVTITAAGGSRVEHGHDQCLEHRPAAAQAYANATAARVLKVANRDAGSLLVLSELGAAELPTTPTNPRATVALASIAFGLIAAVFAALAAGALRRFVAADEISDRLGIPVLGEVPASGSCRVEPGRHVRGGGDERGLEAFQQLRSRLHVMFRDTHPVIAFTSCDPREGKSSVAAHAAWALATPGQFVVAVDGDLRQPRLHEIFGVGALARRERHPRGHRPDRALGPDGEPLSGGRFRPASRPGIRRTSRRRTSRGCCVRCASRIGRSCSTARRSWAWPRPPFW